MTRARRLILRIIYTNKLLLIESYLNSENLRAAKRVANSLRRMKDCTDMLSRDELDLVDTVIKASRIREVKL